MKTQPNALVWSVIALLCLAQGGCSLVSSTARRSGAVALGAAAGGAGGYLLGDEKPEATLLGAMAGGALTSLALGQDREVKQEGFDQGYVQGQSDAIKRQYFLRHALEAQPPTDATDRGQPVYYVVPGPEVTADGRKLAPHTVAVRVIE